jgi:uncharacterized protein YeaO (DUF488 family)
MAVRIKRVYDEPSEGDGIRILVDRLWPRGLLKEKAAVDIWMKDIAPSTELRVWFAHDPAKWTEFQLRYRQELESNPAVDELRRQLQLAGGPATLLYGAKDPEHNHARVLRDYLQ